MPVRGAGSATVASMTETEASPKPRRPPIFGPEPWSVVAGVEWCHFDRWFALVTVADFDGDLEALEEELAARLRSPRHSRRDLEAKLSHLSDLRDGLARAGIAVGRLAEGECDPKVLSKARRKVLDQWLEGRAMTEAMRETPRVRLERRARYGHWPHFPGNPDRFYEKLAGKRPPSHVPKGRSFAVTRRLEERLERHDARCHTEADRLALYRAFHTVGVELAERGDDSFGVIGEMRRRAFTTYLGIDWAAAGMEHEAWWQDLCELLVSEDYALTFEHETLPFRRVRAGDAELVEAILLDLAGEYRAAHLDYQADEALQLVAWLHLAGRRYTKYVEAAERLGSEHWRPAVTLAESAIAGGWSDLAVEVFRAADRPGFHRDTLRRRCRELTGVVLDETPHLRLVEEGDP